MHIRNLLYHYLFFFYFSAVYQALCFAFNVSGFVGLRESFFLSFLWFIPILLLPSYHKIITGVIGLLLWSTSLASLGYFMMYGQEFSQSVLFIIFESNMKESSEFLHTYFAWWMVPALLFYTLMGLFLWKKLQPIELKMAYKPFAIVFALLLATKTFTGLYLIDKKGFEKAYDKQLSRMQAAAPWNLIVGYEKYTLQLQQMQSLLKSNQNLPKLTHFTTQYNQPNTMVLVIGESTNRNRMSLYGYKRETSPHLKKMKDELLVFDNVFSPRPYTIEVLQQALTFADEKNPDWYLDKPNLMNIMKQAGYETYWITNQQTQTKRNTMLTTFSQMADHQIYLNNNRRQNSSSYDEVVFEPFKEVLSHNEIKKKFIVVHLLGAHSRYDYRYPETFSQFDNEPVQRVLDAKQQAYYNYYDNAILYNDYVVSTLINEVKKQKRATSLLYFSDHGEEVYDDINKIKMGRNEAEPTLAMYTVPFIVYGNASWKALHSYEHMNIYTHRLYSSSNLLYSYCDLAGIRFDGFEEEKSIFNTAYETQPIFIGDPMKKATLRDLREKPLG